MSSQRCPGQDSQYWKPEDVFDVICPGCRNEVEFCKDEPIRICGHCQREVRNPKLDLACAKWCVHAASCLGTLKNAADPASTDPPASAKEQHP